MALLLGFYALIRIWVRGDGGAFRATFAMLVAMAILAWPVTYYALHMRLPKISDVSTDTSAPPRFSPAVAKRGPGANPVTYPGPAAAQLQQAAYPDLRTFVIDRSVKRPSISSRRPSGACAGNPSSTSRPRCDLPSPGSSRSPSRP